MSEFGRYIRKTRERKEWSLREAAKRTKVPHSRLFELESGISSKTGKPVVPTMDNIENLAKGLELPIDHLFALAYFPGYLKDRAALSSTELGMLDLFRQMTPARRDLWLRIGEGLKGLPLADAAAAGGR